MKRSIGQVRQADLEPWDTLRSAFLPCVIVTTVGALLALYLLGKSGAGDAYYIAPQVELFLEINQALSAWPLFWRNVTEFGDALVLFPFFAFLIYRNPQVWAAMFGAVPLSAVLSSLGKHLAAIPRPAGLLAHDQFTIIGPALSAHNSLPSGHTITVFAVVTVIVGSLVSFERGLKGKWWIPAGFSIAAFISLSRLAVGAHWPLDVVLGAYFGFLGGVSGILLTRYDRRWWSWLSARRAQGVSGVLMMGWGAVLGYDSVVVGHKELVVPWIAALCAIGVGSYLMVLFLVSRIDTVRYYTGLSPRRFSMTVESTTKSKSKLLD